MRKFFVILLFPLLVSSCEDKGTDDQGREQSEEEVRAAENRAREIKNQVLELSFRYNAVTNWANKLNAEFYQRFYTVRVQNFFLKQKERPFLFFGSIDDIKKVNSEYLLIANADHLIDNDFGFKIHFHLRLSCDAQKVERILSQGPPPFAMHALLATIHSVKKPDIYVHLHPTLGFEFVEVNRSFPEAYSDDFNDLVLTLHDTLGDTLHNWSYRIFVVTGKCEDLIFVGTDDWRYEPSDYERFRQIFDINQP